MTKEERENATTSLRFNQGKLRWGLVHYKSLEPMVRVLMYGAEKYADNNWMKPIKDNRQNLECLQRHLAALMDGEENDKESGLPHIGHIMCNALFFQYHFDKAKEYKSWTPLEDKTQVFRESDRISHEDRMKQTAERWGRLIKDGSFFYSTGENQDFMDALAKYVAPDELVVEDIMWAGRQEQKISLKKREQE